MFFDQQIPRFFRRGHNGPPNMTGANSSVAKRLFGISFISAHVLEKGPHRAIEWVISNRF